MDQLKEIIYEVFYAIFPVTAVVLLLQFTLFWLPAATVIQFLTGILFVSAGLVLFLIGVQVGLLPVGELIGSSLPRTGRAWIVILSGFVLGFAVTVAEPDVHVLAGYVDQVSGGAITKWSLIFPVALGLGIFVALAMVRVITGISVKWLLFAGYSVVFSLLLFAPVPDTFIPISFDAGGVTTGPMAVPFILAFGVGVASVLRSDGQSNAGFGLVGLASIGPLLALLILGLIYG